MDAICRRLRLHLQRTSPVQVVRECAFTLMSALAEEAIAMVRAVAMREREDQISKGKTLEDTVLDHKPLDQTAEHRPVG